MSTEKTSLENETTPSCLGTVISGYSMTKLERPLEILTYDELRLVGVTEIGLNPHLGILYVIGERKHFEKEPSYIIINRL